MSEISEKIRYVLQFYFDNRWNASKACEKICAVYGDDALSQSTARKWFARFRSGNLDVKNAPRSGRPITDKVDEIMEKVQIDRHISSHDIARELKINHNTVLNHLHKAGYKKKIDVWVPHELSEKSLINRISICESLLKRNEIEPFLNRMIVSDEKWITYDTRKRSWSETDERGTLPKPELTKKKLMLCIWWDCKGIIHYELLRPGQTIDSNLYCQQLLRLKEEIEKKRPKLIDNNHVVFHYDSTKPHTSLMTRQKLRDLGWEVLMHPPYSPDIAPSDFYLFRSLQNSLSGIKLSSEEDCEKHLHQYFKDKTPDFYREGIMGLPNKWQKVVSKNGQYLD
ncbi:histone-lysine N-methyltransferase SETMAR-like [Teleopsis dalmanni]|uniref:histone-lysine N-methyltransferase SETMAR-like n=1 Tax=Teleopsis dalmanni TaxID=139649 RepID=UPI0018CFADEA|nr:histone-lysine N-methyltransferase SETMAR-like [Teleopsis dalmanni]XP_037948260.1 histone-lysine N-methyltransferase SETMAR-like [Teleopsis dalmanni]XP_037960394.1 histone-lysine N-methyltransferase SETMAR-like [Teleopsis dalmanni]